MAEFSNTVWILLLLFPFCVVAQDLSKKSMNFATFDCLLTIKNVKWNMECESQTIMIDSSPKFFIANLSGIFNPVSPVVYDELLQSTTFKESELHLCESQWKDVLKIEPSIIYVYCENYNKFLKTFTRLLNETTLKCIEITHAPKIEFMLNILYESSHLSHIILRDNTLSYISSFPVYQNNSITSIELQRNEIGNITEGLFSDFPRLQLLDLSHNLLKFVHKSMFQGINALSELDLSFNMIESISNDTLSDLVSLKKILLNNNNLKYISEELFRFNDLLAHIDISNNELKDLPSSLFHNLHNLKNISCSNCNLFALDSDLFANSQNILRMNFSCNNLKSLSEDIFNKLQFLKALDLGNNKISHLSKNHFKNKQYLLRLNLTQNEIQLIENGLFFEAPNIKFLDMSKNQIKTLNDDHIKNFTDLERFSLRQNRLESVDLGIAINRVLIRALDISHNIITKLNIGWKRLVFMERFIVDNNQLTSLDLPPCIPSVKQTVTFSFKYNNISKINVEALIVDQVRVKSDQSMAAWCFFNGHEKNFVDLTHNPLFCDCKLYPFYEYLKDKSLGKLDAFLEENSLSCADPLYVSNVPLISLSDDMLSCPLDDECPESCYCGVRGKDNLAFVNCSSRNFKEAPQTIPAQISVLYFNNNKLESIVSLNNEVWRNLSEVHLDHNFLESIDDWSIPKSLNYLSLRGNKLKTLSPSLMEFIGKQSSFDLFLGKNDENCDCDRKELKSFLMKNIQFIRDNEDILCIVTNNETSTFLPLTSVPDSDLCPLKSNAPNYFQKKLVISLCVFFSCLICLLLTYYKQRQLILSFFYIHCNDLFRFCFSEEDYDENHIFDAFVAYSSSDQEIVMELVEELETNPPYFQLCIHERNWLPGLFITDNIINSVHSSKRTIVVLSNTFTTSPWFNLELRAAVFKMSKNKMSRIIVILTEKSVSLDNIDSELRHVISKRTYLVWGERWFWQKLKYAMPRKKRAKSVTGNNRRSISEISLMPERI